MKIKLILCLAFTFVLSLSVFSNKNKTINFVTDPEKQGGFLLEITKAAFEKVGYTVNVQFQPWARALHNVTEGNDEALLGARYDTERAKAILYSDAIGKSYMEFYKMKNTRISYTKLEDLKPYSIGTIQKAVYTPEFDSASYLKKEPVYNFLQNIKKLISGRIQLFLEKRSVVLYAIKTQFPECLGKIDYLEPPLKEMLYYNCFSRKIPGYEQKAGDFNTGLKMIIRDGTFKKIMDSNLHE